MNALLATALNIQLSDDDSGELQPLVEAVFILTDIDYELDVTEEGKEAVRRVTNTQTMRFTASPAACRAAANDMMKFADIAEQSAARWQLVPAATEMLGESVCEQIAKWVTEGNISPEALDEELDDMVHGSATTISTARNNDGTQSQINFLLEQGMTAAQILTHIHRTLILKEEQ